MSRPASGRTERFEVRITADESAMLLQRAEEAGYKTLSEFVRGRLLDGRAPLTPRVMSLERAEIIRTLTLVGERLNLLAHLCAHDDVLRAESEGCLTTLRETIGSLAS